MSKPTSYPVGAPSFVDVVSPDVEETAAFYSGLFAWDIEELSAETGGYVTARLDGSIVAGFRPAQNPERANWESYFNTYFTVRDADAAAEAVEAAGGAVVVPPFDVLTAGRTATCADPEGTAFSIWEPREFGGAETFREPGAFSYVELSPVPLGGVKQFYSEVMGWAYVDHGDPVHYTECLVEGRRVAGIMGVPGNVSEREFRWNSVWTVYFAVADIRATLAKVSELGGRVTGDTPGVAGKILGENLGLLSFGLDPLGTLFGLVQYAELPHA